MTDRIGLVNQVEGRWHMMRDALHAPWVPILMYHRVVPVLPEYDPYRNCIDLRTFGGHLEWLARWRYRSLSLSKLDHILDRGRGSAILSRSIVITFDDGYEDNYLYAWPLLRRYGFAATIFLVSDAIGADNSFDIGYQGHVPEPAPMLSVAQIREMRRGDIDFGSHTCSHPSTLVDLDDGALAHELEDSRRVIEEIVDVTVNQFSYPHTESDARVEAAVACAGYRLACGGRGNRFSSLCLQRIEPNDGGGVALERQIRTRQIKRLVRRMQSTTSS